MPQGIEMRRLLLAGAISLFATHVVAVGCPPEGDSKKPKLAAQDVLKNRLTVPGSPNPKVTLAALIAPGEDLDRWEHDEAAQVTGYVSDVVVGGIESSNCHAEDEPNRDVHIYLSRDSQNATKVQSVIVEITPGMRAKLEHETDWTTAA